jgi:hypothetical protein
VTGQNYLSELKKIKLSFATAQIGLTSYVISPTTRPKINDIPNYDWSKLFNKNNFGQSKFNQMQYYAQLLKSPLKKI